MAQLLNPDPPKDGATVSIHRDAHTTSSLTKAYNIQWEDEIPAKDQCKQCAKDYFQCSGQCLKDRLLRFFPFIMILKNYQWKKWLVYDFVSGLSVGVIHIPQGMGFALLTSVPPVFGLYSSFFPILIYFFFGTSKHISLGTMAVISLMIGDIVDVEIIKMGYPAEIIHNSTTDNVTDALIHEIDAAKVGIAVSVSLLVGAYQFLMGFLGLGIVATFMSMPFVGSFLCGASVHIITSQSPLFFGLRLKKRSGLFRNPLIWYDLFAHILDTNVGSFVTALICFAFLVVIKEVINEKFRSRLKVPIPAEFIVIIVGTLASHFGKFHEKYDVRIIGHIPKGFPTPRMPPMTNVQSYAGSSVLIAIVSFAISITMAKLMAKKHKYSVDVNQELYAYGLSNGVSAFFNCFAGAQAPPRTLVHDAVGGQTQLSSLISAVLILLVIVVIAPLFQSLPTSVLSAIIICALLPIFRQFKELPNYWRLNKNDMVVFLVTFLATVFLDVTVGLAVGVGLSILLIVIHGHLASGSALVSVDNSDIFIQDKRLVATQVGNIPGVRVFRFDSPLFFANVEKFKAQIFEKTINPMNVTKPENDKNAQKDNNPEIKTAVRIDDIPDLRLRTENGTKTMDLLKGATKIDPDTDIKQSQDNTKNDMIHTIILDCSPITYIDIMGINLLKGLLTDYKSSDIDFVLVNCGHYLNEKLERAGVIQHSNNTPQYDMPTENKIPTFMVFPTIQDAIVTSVQSFGRDITRIESHHL